MDQASQPSIAIMMPSSCLGPIPVSPLSQDDRSRFVWNEDSIAVPSFLGVEMNADAASCSSISECDSMEGNDADLESLISLEDRYDVSAESCEVFAPYPFDRQTREELDNFHQLGLSFGEAWSLQLAEEVTCEEDMSIEQTDDEEDLKSCVKSMLVFDESEEVKAMRNRLWKQSLKTSMFTKSSLPCDR